MELMIKGQNGEFCIFGEIGYIAMLRCFPFNSVKLTAAEDQSHGLFATAEFLILH